MEDILWGIAQTMLVAICEVVASALAVWIIQQVRLSLAKLDEEKRKVVVTLAERAVMAAEQAKLGGLINDKKEYAVDLLNRWLHSRGIKIDADDLSAHIEAAVLSVINGV